jgi:hypothetical protein
MTEMASIEEVKDFCNKVREAGGANPLDSLLPAIPQKANECLIALNLNFSCEVDARGTYEDWMEELEHLGYQEGETIWGMTSNPEVAGEISEALDIPILDEEYDNDTVVLPAKIARVAEAFDAWLKNPALYPELDDYVHETAKERIAEVGIENWHLTKATISVDDE